MSPPSLVKIKLPAPAGCLPPESSDRTSRPDVTRWEDRCLRNWQDRQAAPGGPWQPVLHSPAQLTWPQHMCRDARPSWGTGCGRSHLFTHKGGAGGCACHYQAPGVWSCGHFMSSLGFSSKWKAVWAPQAAGEACTGGGSPVGPGTQEPQVVRATARPGLSAGPEELHEASSQHSPRALRWEPRKASSIRAVDS